jgi:hypothetical protein
MVTLTKILSVGLPMKFKEKLLHYRYGIFTFLVYWIVLVGLYSIDMPELTGTGESNIIIWLFLYLLIPYFMLVGGFNNASFFTIILFLSLYGVILGFVAHMIYLVIKKLR